MPTLAEMRFDILNIASSGKENYSLRIEEAQIDYWIAQARAKFIAEAIQRRDNITDTWVQSISCMELIQVDASECCLVNTNCYILRTKDKLPPTIEYYLDNGIIRVVTPDGTVIAKSNPFASKYGDYNKYTANTRDWFLQNGYLYITSEDLLTYITVYALFENPMDLANFTACSGDTCFSDSDPYPVSNKMANDITNYIIRAKVLPFYSTIPDTSNNANNESGTINPNGLTAGGK
jgi:hypothetical protein